MEDKELRNLIKAYQNGDRLAGDRVVKSVEGMVYHTIDKNFKHVTKFSREDLASVGFMGVTYAMKKYDINRKERFTTFVWWDIWGKIKNFLKNYEEIHYPKRLKFALKDRETLLLTDEELKEKYELTDEELKSIEGASVYCLSLDEYLGGDNEFSQHIDMLEDEYNNIEEFEGKMNFEEMISCLKENEKEVIRMVIVNGYTKKDTAIELGVSQTTVRARYNRALGKIKNHIIQNNNCNIVA